MSLLPAFFSFKYCLHFFHNFHVFPFNVNSLEIFLFHNQVAISQLIVVNLNSNCCRLPASFNFHVSHHGVVQERLQGFSDRQRFASLILKQEPAFCDILFIPSSLHMLNVLSWDHYNKSIMSLCLIFSPWRCHWHACILVDKKASSRKTVGYIKI